MRGAVGNRDDDSRSLLSLAAAEGSIQVVKELIKTNPGDADLKDTGSGRTPLSWAAENGHEIVVDVLIATGTVDPDSQDEYCQTPISWAAREGHKAVVKALLSSGRVDPDSKDTIQGQTPLCWAVSNGHEGVLDLLLSTGRVNPDLKIRWSSTSIWWDSEYGCNGTEKTDDKFGDMMCPQTPLSFAAGVGHDKIVKLLLESGNVDINSKGMASGLTPIAWAALGGHEVVVSLLLDSGKADPDSKDKFDRTPLCLAAQRGYLNIVTLLLNTGKVNPDSKDRLGRTPIHLAARSGHLDVVLMLLNTGKVDPDSKDFYDRTPLLQAARNGHEIIVEVLLDSGKVDPDSKETASGQTPLSVAAKAGYEAVVKLLLDSRKADACTKDEFGVTPLLWAADEGHEAVVKLLLDTGKMDMDFKAESGLEIDSRCIHRWIKACNELHDGQCQPTPVEKRQPHQIPHWVIDTQLGCIIPGCTVSRYVALSYVWGSDQGDTTPHSAARLLLKRSNLSDFQQPGFLNRTTALDLPQVVKDTINLICKFGERYLWVDCLCIVQHDEGTRAQVDQMDQIYSGAYFTVIAAASPGLFSMRGKVRKSEMRNFTWLTSSPVQGYVEDHYQSLLESKWATRGWTFQELILSKRAAIFVNGNLFWDCQRSFWNKCGLIPGAPAETDGSRSRYYEMARRMASTSWPDFSLYIEMVCLYNSRDLTYPQDALPAFSGILNSLARSFPSGFVSGLPRLFLDVALLWQPFSMSKRRIAKEGGSIGPEKYIPSWSWCGWQCPVDPFSLRTGLTYLDHEDHQARALSWQTRRLVQWSVLSEDMQQGEQLDEPMILESYKHLRMREDAKLPDGWSRNIDACSKLGAANDVPINEAAFSTAPCEQIWPFLFCEAPQAFFCVGAILKPITELTYQAAMKMSVFDLPQFTNGPALDSICHVICLEDRQGRPAGQLRRMDDASIELKDEINLIAISSGSVSYADVESAFEEHINRHCRYSYSHGMRMVKFQRVSPGASIEHGYKTLMTGKPKLETVETEWLYAPLDYDDSNNKRDTSTHSSDRQSENEYHFYNVLWIERKGDIAYRRAAGRVPKAIWEENCSESTKVILG